MLQRGGNRITDLEELEKNHMRHLQHLNQMRPTVDSRLSSKYAQLATERSTSVRKSYHQRVREEQIAHENSLIMQKIVTIIVKDTDPVTGLTRPKRSESEQYSQSFQNLAVMRKRDQDIRLAEQNMQMLRRLTEIKPTIQKRAFDRDREQTERYINSISHFRYRDHKPNKFLYKVEAWKRLKALEKLQPVSAFQSTGAHERQMTTPVPVSAGGGAVATAAAMVTGTSAEIAAQDAAGFNALPPVPNAESVLYERKRRIGRSLYQFLVRLENGFLVITAENLEQKERRYQIEFEQREGVRILVEECNYDFGKFLDRVKIEQDVQEVYFRKFQPQARVLLPPPPGGAIQRTVSAMHLPPQPVIPVNPPADVRKQVFQSKNLFTVRYVTVGTTASGAAAGAGSTSTYGSSGGGGILPPGEGSADYTLDSVRPSGGNLQTGVDQQNTAESVNVQHQNQQQQEEATNSSHRAPSHHSREASNAQLPPPSPPPPEDQSAMEGHQN